MLVVTARAGLKTYVLETFPTNLPLLELAVAVLRGQRIVEGPAGGSTLRAAQMRESVGNENGASHSLYHAAEALRVLGRLGEAERVAGRALALVDRPGPYPEYRAWWVGVVHEHLGRTYVDQKRFADAHSEYQQAREIDGDAHHRALRHLRPRSLARAG